MKTETPSQQRDFRVTERPVATTALRKVIERTEATYVTRNKRRRRVTGGHLSGWLGLLLTLANVGCGYTVGKDFRTDIQSVAVPIFENTTNRQGIEYQLTEAVQKEITKRSHYRLSKGLNADTRLTGKIIGFRKDVLGETAQDDPRELQVTLMVQVRWEDLRTGELIAEQEMPLTPEALPITGQSEFSPELGQSLATAMDDALNSMARKIVNLMEVPW